jgi:DNA-binding MarR family transcriptional regulator
VKADPAGAAAPAASRPEAGAESAHAEVAARLWQGMRTLVLERHDRRREVCEALGMSFIRAKALRALAAGPMAMRQLADRLSTDPPYTTVVVDDLQRRGLARRGPDPGDRRLRIVTLTPAGADAAELAGRILGSPPAPVLALDAQDLAALDRVVTKLLGAGAGTDGDNGRRP